MSFSASGSRLRSYHVRARDALLITGDFRGVAEDFELHAMSCDAGYDARVSGILVDGLTALGFHLVTRPPDEYVGWTLHLAELGVDLFLTGSARSGSLAGRAFESLDAGDGTSTFTSQVKRPSTSLEEARLEVTGVDFFSFVESLWQSVLKRPARFFRDGGEIAFLAGLPGADEKWLGAVQPAQAFSLAVLDDVRFLADRVFSFRCGCDREKLLRYLVAAYDRTPEALFGGAKEVTVTCPRCAAQYTVTPEDYERRRHSPGGLR